MTEILLSLHGWLRWGVTLAGLFGLIRSAILLKPGGAPGGLDRGLRGAYLGMMDANILIGIVFWITLGFPGRAVPHGLIMVAGAALAHVFFARSRRTPGSPTRSLAAGYLFSMILIVVGQGVIEMMRR